jgi:hypothetical protein
MMDDWWGRLRTAPEYSREQQEALRADETRIGGLLRTETRQAIAMVQFARPGWIIELINNQRKWNTELDNKRDRIVALYRNDRPPGRALRTTEM